MNDVKYTFDNIEALQRNREIEGEKGTEIGLPGGITLTVLAASDANPRWRARSEQIHSELRRLSAARATPERQRSYLSRVYADCLVVGWSGVTSNDVEVPFSPDACAAFLRLADDAFEAIGNVVHDTKMFRGERIQIAVDQGKA